MNFPFTLTMRHWQSLLVWPNWQIVLPFCAPLNPLLLVFSSLVFLTSCHSSSPCVFLHSTHLTHALSSDRLRVSSLIWQMERKASKRQTKKAKHIQSQVSKKHWAITRAHLQLLLSLHSPFPTNSQPCKQPMVTNTLSNARVKSISKLLPATIPIGCNKIHAYRKILSVTLFLPPGPVSTNISSPYAMHCVTLFWLFF